MPHEEWRRLDARARCARACAAQLEFGRRRRRQQTLLRVLCAPAGARHAAYSVIQLITDDMPFLVDTLQHDADAGRLVAADHHPSDPARAARRRAASMRSLDQESAGATAASSESWQYLRIDRVGDAAECAAAAAASCWRRWRDVRRACKDWMRMRNQVLRLCADISRNPPPLPPDVIAESRALLQYMEAHHFTFLGYRENRAAAGAAAARAAAGSGHRTRAAAPAPAGIRATAACRRQHPAGAALARAAGDHQGQHALDRAPSRPTSTTSASSASMRAAARSARRAFSDSGTRSAYRADPRQVPWLRHKLKRVIEHFPFAPNSHDGKRLQQILQSLPRDELFQASVAGSDPHCARGAGAAGARTRAPDPATR